MNLETLRHSVSHIMAQAVKELYPDVKLGIGPATSDGFYYDFEKSTPFTPDDLFRIEKKMHEIIKANVPFIEDIFSREEAIKMFEELNESYKVELLREMDNCNVTVYRQGEFTDLCRGPHLRQTGETGKHFKLLDIAGAYWRGDERRPMLQRIYGTAFLEEAELQSYLEMQEEAKRRDHRKLGVELDLFSVGGEIGGGLVLWHPKGAVVRGVIEDFWRDEHTRRGYQLVYTPHIANASLWEKSGHLNYYSDLMYPLINVGNEEYLLKPMNCPLHIQIYKSHRRSYRDLPIRYGELGTVYRYERSGVLHGLLRTRGFTQDDAHIFCTPEQAPDEISGVIDLVKFMMESFGYKDLKVDLSVRDPLHKEKYMGGDRRWHQAEEILLTAIKSRGLDYKKKEREAVFYGPKIDIHLADALGKWWQGPTIQFDFNLPSQMDITYIGADGKAHDVIMIHRTVLGATERFIAGLIEYYKGALPIWLAPIQVAVLTISEKQEGYAAEVLAALLAAGLRAEIDKEGGTINAKIRQAEIKKVPCILIIGNREVAEETVSVRERKIHKNVVMKIEKFVTRAKEKIRNKEVG
ncbi:threonine--tRNA ligase [candidate division NPL-UPA2 bacterium Unc8]|uniref:Threonine--tRNA ligase n=1 Tax=candidate division NPL-UPA2 bacterium Unc8 TaxID=1980939 RepID=A0A399FYI2_UNCN2|nr:Threonine--tRNA ligase [Bacillota bacterium]MBT9137807.1 Threonine--tRNA ligase [Bacillota bacterium]MBT9146801.1 Threonine--tRNA ligase [Bacillota bacterium]RII00253.1 MAG: threonine--tRNA ligase [candidate division NPL-UPA2 bacterium Unc8]